MCDCVCVCACVCVRVCARACGCICVRGCEDVSTYIGRTPVCLFRFCCVYLFRRLRSGVCVCVCACVSVSVYAHTMD